MAAFVTVVCVATSCANGTPQEGEQRRPSMGTASTSLTLDGEPWWPVGLNAYQLGTDWRVNAGCGAQVDLDGYFARLPPHTLTRFNAYSSLAVDEDTGELDFGPLDAVFEAAERHGQLLNAVLANSEGSCEGGEFKGHDWFAGQWRTQVLPGEPMPYRDWVDTAVRRWRDSAAAAAWTPVGEPEPSICAAQGCDWQVRDCPADAAVVVRTFIDKVGERIRALDPDALIWEGRAGGGQCGSAGDDYAYVGASPGVDVLEYHTTKSAANCPVTRSAGSAAASHRLGRWTSRSLSPNSGCIPEPACRPPGAGSSCHGPSGTCAPPAPPVCCSGRSSPIRAPTSAPTTSGPTIR